MIDLCEVNIITIHNIHNIKFVKFIISINLISFIMFLYSSIKQQVFVTFMGTNYIFGYYNHVSDNNMWFDGRFFFRKK